MEDAVTAVIMAFSMLVFMIALSLCMYMVGLVTATSSHILYLADETNFMENIEISDLEITKRDVDFDTIIPTLYRYYKENFCVKIYDGRVNPPEFLHVFDIKTEAAAASAASKIYKERNDLALDMVYNDDTLPTYLHQAPWLGSPSHMKTRIDFYVSGQSGVIKDVTVDYSDRRADVIENLQDLKDIYDNDTSLIIEESFVEYNFSGDTITTDDGTESITGDKQVESKIIIIYTLKSAS